MEIRPPLIDKPSQCRRLSLTALKINLLLHAKWDKTLLETATKAELTSGLEDFLLTRHADILLRGFVYGAGTGRGMDVEEYSEDSF